MSKQYSTIFIQLSVLVLIATIKGTVMEVVMAVVKSNYNNYRSSRPEVFLVKGALKICRKFTGEHPCRSVISIKLLCVPLDGCFYNYKGKIPKLFFF